MANFTRMGVPFHYIGLAADTKPTGVDPGSRCYEYDTGNWYVTYDGTNWVFERNALAVERSLEKSDGGVLNGADNIFVVAGGPVYAMLIGVVTTVIGGAANCKIQHTTTTPAATVDLSTNVAIDSDAAGTSYRFVGATGVLTPDTNGAKIVDPVTVADCRFLLPIGTLKATCDAARTGNIKWYLVYKPLSPLSVVTVAA